MDSRSTIPPLRLSVILCLLSGVTTLPVFGQIGPSPTADPSPLADVPLEQLMQVPVEFVTGASKYEQDINRAPASVTVLTSEDIRNYGWRTLADALRAAPGFHIRSDRFYDYIGNRGFTRPNDYNSRTLILINGHRINDAIFQTGAIGTDFILDLGLIDRIEIIRGPGSSVYGSSAFYGAINIIPKKGRDFNGGQASVSVGSEPSLKGRATIGNRTASGVEYMVSVTDWYSNGEENFDLPDSWRAATGLTDQKAKGYDGMHQQSTYANVTWKNIETEAAFMKRRKDVLPSLYDTNLTDPSYGIDQRGYILTRVSGNPTADSTLTATIALDYYSYEGLFSPAVAPGVFEQQHPHSQSLSLNQETRWQQEFAERHVLIGGFEYQENFIQNIARDNRTLGTTPVNVKESSQSFSPFVQVDWGLLKNLWLSTGARFDDYSTGESHFSPRIGLIWDVTPTTNLKLLYGQSFRVPNTAERYTAEIDTIPNPNLRPELNNSWELVADHRISPTWQVDGHLYYIASSDLIQSVQISSAPVLYTNENVQKVVTKGAEIGASASLFSNIQVRGSATVQRSEDTMTGNDVIDAPRRLLKLNVSAPVYENWLRASAEVQYVGDRLDSLGATANQYWTGNLTLRASQVWQHWDFTLSVYNIGGTQWSDPQNVGQITSMPRVVVLRATLNF